MAESAVVYMKLTCCVRLKSARYLLGLSMRQLRRHCLMSKDFISSQFSRRLSPSQISWKLCVFRLPMLNRLSSRCAEQVNKSPFAIAYTQKIGVALHLSYLCTLSISCRIDSSR